MHGGKKRKGGKGATPQDFSPEEESLGWQREDRRPRGIAQGEEGPQDFSPEEESLGWQREDRRPREVLTGKGEEPTRQKEAGKEGG